MIYAYNDALPYAIFICQLPGRLEKTLSHVSTGEHRSAPGCLFRHGHFHTIKTLTCLCSPPSNSICQTRTLIRSSKTVIAQCLGLQILVLQELYLDVLLKAGLAKRKNISRTCIYWNVWEMRSWTTTLRHHSILISIRFYLWTTMKLMSLFRIFMYSVHIVQYAKHVIQTMENKSDFKWKACRMQIHVTT